MGVVRLVSSKGHRSSDHCDVVDIKVSNHLSNESSLIRIGDVSTSTLVIGRVKLLKSLWGTRFPEVQGCLNS